MVHRKLFRKILLQTLYEWDMRGCHNKEIELYLNYIISSFNNVSDDMIEVFEAAHEIGKKHVMIDEIIEKAAPDWTLEKISITDRNVLRIGLYELLFCDYKDVPPKVAINEAIELAKTFGGPKSNKFVNGVLGAVYREIGEPHKTHKKTKKNIYKTLYEEMPIDEKGSAVVYSIDDYDVIRIGMVHDIFGYWTLAKGSIKENETVEEGTIRKIKEETNWKAQIIKELGDNEYIAYHPKRGPVRKHVRYFLAQSLYTSPTLESRSGGLDDVRWFELNEISDLNMYEDVSHMLIQAIENIVNSDPKEDKLIDTEQQSDKPDYISMKVSELRALAKQRGYSGYSSLKKAELINLLSK